MLTIRIKSNNPADPKRVKCFAKGKRFAVTECLGTHNFTITHIPTGWAVDYAWTLREAKGKLKQCEAFKCSTWSQSRPSQISKSKKCIQEINTLKKSKPRPTC